jgi:hypothetical protein
VRERGVSGHGLFYNTAKDIITNRLLQSLNLKNRFMESIKIRNILLMLIFSFVSCMKEETEVFNLNLEQKQFPSVYNDWFMVSNSPEEINSIISFFNREVKKTQDAREKSIDSLVRDWNIRLDISKRENPDLFKDDKKISKKDVNYCTAFYYNERMFFDRTYIVPKQQPVFYWERWLYIGYDIRYKGHEDDLFIIIYYKRNEFEFDDPVLPYLYIKKIDSFYFPKGLRTNPNIHWKKGDWIPR